MGKFRRGSALAVEETGRTAFAGVQLCRVLATMARARDWRATLRRSSHRGRAPLHQLFWPGFFCFSRRLRGGCYDRA